MEQIFSVLSGFLSFILVVFPIVILHEFGHFIVGKWLKAEPEEFSVGFGKSLFNFQWLDANFKIGWIPLGGYVKFKKSQFDIEFGEGKKTGGKIAPWRWFFISIAGPFTNFLLTFILFTSFMFIAYQEREVFTVSQVNKEIKIKVKEEEKVLSTGDRILFIESTGANKMFKRFLLGENSNHEVYVALGEEPSPLVSTEFKKEEILSSLVLVKKEQSILENFKNSLFTGGLLMVGYTVATADALIKLVSTDDGFKQMMGPVGIASEADKARGRGIFDILFIMAALSFAVGFFNMLPLTFLDGGRALIAVFESFTKKSISMVTLERLNFVGLVIMLGLFLAGNVSDFLRMKNPQTIESTTKEKPE